LSGRIYLRIGFRATALIGSAFIVAGTLLAATLLGEHASVWTAAAAAFVLGVGLGLCSSPTLVAAPSVVGWERRGVVTGTYMFSRSLGSAIGAAFFGAIANATLAERFAHPPGALAGRLPGNVDATSVVLGGHTVSGPPAVAAYLRSSLQGATHYVFLTMVVVAVLGVGALLLIPRRTEPLTFDT
jgi:MFS family permease